MALNLEIITPEKVIFSEEVEMVVAPGSEGELGIMENHAALTTSLQEGEIYIFDKADSAKPKWGFTIDGGFAQTIGDKCTILSDSCVFIVDESHPAPSHEGKSDSRAAAEKAFLKSAKK